ncbi:GNAT superfamily N-acetyltransferase [Metabacillus crassostreae]|uniref:GNAT family N-acetyltransferase n=1 Tax=Metabacillus crassostreae TaxID=929098 RepID=UPI00195BC2B8|nr:GNAT family N-acetyltransferase [Metabacillus crassostreae]MBM7602498.1 GNAT superfamily N-acetyltransferase [Metabacillus crassostreae]
MTIKWVEVTNENLSYFEAVMKLYDQAFPIEVREHHSIFHRSLTYAKMINQNNFHFLVGLIGDDLVSFATAHYFAEINSGFIVYIVTNPQQQNNGVGTKTLAKIEDLLKADAIHAGNSSIRAIFLETETEEMAHTEEEKKECINRNRFFSRNHYENYEQITYLQPPLHEGMEDFNLNLFIKNLSSTKNSKEDIKKAIKTIYKEKYLLVNEIDKEILNKALKKMGIEDELL